MKPIVSFFFEGDTFFNKLREAFQTAQKSIDIELYYFASDKTGKTFAELLIRKLLEGVRVRILYDAVGCRTTSSHFLERLEQSGMEIKVYHPLLPLGKRFSERNHRKVFIIDGHTAFLGGLNLADEYSQKACGEKAWRDTGVCIEDLSVVRKLQDLFELSWSGKILRWRKSIFRRQKKPDWQKDNFHIIPSPGWRRKSLIREEYLSAISQAQQSILITNSYFIPDHGFRRALKKAAKRGVNVCLLTAGYTDVNVARWAGQATYSTLLKSGVKIYEYQGRILHAKSAVIDEQWFTVGTSNIDYLSFYRNLEVNLFGRDIDFAKQLFVQFNKDLTVSCEITPQVWRQRPWWAKVIEKISYLFRVWL